MQFVFRATYDVTKLSWFENYSKLSGSAFNSVVHALGEGRFIFIFIRFLS